MKRLPMLLCSVLTFAYGTLEAMTVNDNMLSINNEQYNILEKMSNVVLSKIVNEYTNDITNVRQIIIELNNGIRIENRNFNFVRPDMFYNLSQFEQSIYDAAESILNLIISEVQHNKYITDNSKNQVIEVVKILYSKTENDISNFVIDDSK